MKIKENKLDIKLKSLISPNIIYKIPIKRQQAKLNNDVQVNEQISFSEVNSSSAKIIFNNNKRKFGEMGTNGIMSDRCINENQSKLKKIKLIDRNKGKLNGHTPKNSEKMFSLQNRLKIKKK